MAAEGVHSCRQGTSGTLVRISRRPQSRPCSVPPPRVMHPCPSPAAASNSLPVRSAQTLQQAHLHLQKIHLGTSHCQVRA